MTDHITKPKREFRATGFDRFLGVLVAFVALGPPFSYFLELITGNRFLPSVEYYHEYSYLGYFSSVFSSAISIYIFWGEKYYGTYLENSPYSGLMARLRIVLIPLIAALFAFDAPILYPIGRALIFGENTTLRYTVQNATGWSDRKCRDRVWLDSLPSVHDSVCSVPQEIRDQLKPGMQIELEGWGTKDGLFYKQIRIPSSS